MATPFLPRMRRRWATAALIGALSLAGAACGETAGPETGAAIEDLRDEPGDFVGEQVTVSAQVLEDAGDNAFWLGGEDFFTSAILVINRTDTQVQEDMVIQVTGTVELLDLTEFEDDLFTEQETDVFEPFEGRPALVAEQIDMTVPQEQNQ